MYTIKLLESALGTFSWLDQFYVCELVIFADLPLAYIDGLVQERRDSIANALELCLSCTNQSTWYWLCWIKRYFFRFDNSVWLNDKKCRNAFKKKIQQVQGLLRTSHPSVLCDILSHQCSWPEVLHSRIGHFILVAITRTITQVPYHWIKSLQLPWSSGTPRCWFHLPIRYLIINWIAGTWLKLEHRDDSISNAHQGNMPLKLHLLGMIDTT